MILLIDNYDSFTYNLYQQISVLAGPRLLNVEVARNDAITLAEIEELNPFAIVFSPGPGRPCDTGGCPQILRRFEGGVPIFGVCLGHQLLAEEAGGIITKAKTIMHGKTSLVSHKRVGLFRDIPSPFQVARYHSLAIRRDSLPASYRVIAETEDREIMAIEHTAYPSWGVQFHPESFLTTVGEIVMKNFIDLAGKWNGTHTGEPVALH